MSDQANKIIERVKALLRMANDKSSPNEAAIALKRARHLMDENSLSMADLIEDDKEYGEAATDFARGYRKLPLWFSQIAIYIGKYNDVVMSSSVIEDDIGHRDIKKNFKRIVHYQGFSCDAEAAMFMLFFVKDYALRAFENYKKENPRVDGRAARNSFLMGFSWSVKFRLIEMIKEREAAKPTDVKAGALILKKLAMVESKFGVQKIKKIDTSHFKTNDEAESEGFKKGKEVSLNKVLSDKEKTAKISN